MSRWVLLVALLHASSAAAERRVTVEVPPAPVDSLASISHVIVLDRCAGGCTVTKASPNNARMMQSSIPQGAGPFQLEEFRNAMGQTGAAADADWAKLVTCVREVYSQFDVVVTETRPAEGTYHLALVAGTPGQVGLGSDILGIAPLAGDCSAQDNAISFTFANAHNGGDRTNNLCWTVAQESAHAFGLDHQFMFTDGASTCMDPTTYQAQCGGQRFFRDKTASCGEFAARDCKCGKVQNSHKKLLSVFGPGQTVIAPPTATITFPQPGGAFPAVVAAQAGSQRGVFRADLLLNGSPWASSPGQTFTLTGQANPSTYMINMPGNVPDGITDIVVRACDDLGECTDSAPVTVTKGAPCQSAETCAPHQTCEAGRCSWAPPVGELGESCEYAQFCKSNQCVETTDGKFCSEGCTPEETPGTCPEDLVCAESRPGQGLCVPAGGGGCCSVTTSGEPWAAAVLACLVALRLGRRRTSFAGVRTLSAERDESC
ncbi:MAG: hypothetical protein JNL83_00955 [Myxococcales bacterium]|nr:hypothetical protein [Myxococcales bacterium]